MSKALGSIMRASLEDMDVEMINPVLGNDDTNIDEALAVIDSGAADLDAADETVEVLVTAAASVESLLITMEACIAEGGMTPQTARSHKQAVQFALSRLPGQHAEKLVLSTESFGGHGDKQVASMESAAGLKAFLKKLVEGIIKAIKSAWDSASKFVKSMAAAGPALVSNAKMLKAKASSMKKATSTKETLDVPVCAGAFQMGGKFNGNLTAALNAMVTGSDQIIHAAKMASTELSNAAVEIAGGTFELSAAREALVNVIERANPTGDLPGGYTFELSESNVFSMVKGDEYTGNTEVPLPSVEQVMMIADRIEQVAKAVVAYDKSAYKALEANVQSLLAAADKAVSVVSEEDAEKGAALKEALNGLSSYTTVARAVGPQYIRYMIANAKIALGFGGSVLKAYSSAK
jgi:hypothetical protein